jgi:hypothetical protein
MKPDNIVTSLNWCVIEVGTAIMCTSLSSLRPLATKFLPNLFTHMTTNSTANFNKYGVQQGESTELSTVSHTRSHSIMMGSKNGERIKDDENSSRGQTIIRNTFDIREGWRKGENSEGKEADGKESGVYRRTADISAGSSEEELVVGKNKPGISRR